MRLRSFHLFLLLAALSAFFIWGIAIRNGLITLCEEISKAARLPEGTPLRTWYTGVPPVDFILTTNVIFFHQIVQDPVGRWILINGYQLAFAILVCQMVEAGRVQSKAGRTLTLPGTWNVAGQILGVGMLNPVYYFYHARHIAGRREGRNGGVPTTANVAEDTDSESLSFYFSLSPDYAAAILPSVILGGILPLASLVRNAPILPTDTYQIWLAAAQIFPVYISGLVILFSGFFRFFPQWSMPSDISLLRWTYAITIIFAAAVHNISRFAHLEGAVGGPAAFTWLSLYTPTLAKVSALLDVVMVFMRNDILVLGWGAVLWVAWLLKKQAGVSWLTGLFGLIIVHLLLGPGAACVVGFWAREELVRGKGKKIGRVQGSNASRVDKKKL